MNTSNCDQCNHTDVCIYKVPYNDVINFLSNIEYSPGLFVENVPNISLEVKCKYYKPNEWKKELRSCDRTMSSM